MDVFLFRARVLLGFGLILTVSLFACGDRYNLKTERGRQARIDDANFHLSQGNCGAAAEAIDPLYAAEPASDQVRIIKASTLACYSGFSVLRTLGNLAGSGGNPFQGLVKSLDNRTGDGARGNLYSAVSVLTRNGAAMSAGARSPSVNTYMIFYQFGVISAILRNYGSPDCCNGSQGAPLVYSAVANPAGEMSNQDACALGAAFSQISDSFGNADLSAGDVQSVVTSLNSVCVAAGLASCASINKDIDACDGTNANSVTAQAVVNAVDAAW